MNTENKNQVDLNREEIIPSSRNGFSMLIRGILFGVLCVVGFIVGVTTQIGFIIFLSIFCSIFIVPWFFIGLKVIKPNEALVLTFFGKYHGTIRQEGFHYVNPFCMSVVLNDANTTASTTPSATANTTRAIRPRVSLKSTTLNNEVQKINDSLGNPIMIGIVVIWRVTNTAKALFNVDNYVKYLSTQCDSSLRDIVRMYPYDIPFGESAADETSLRGSSQEIAEKLKEEIQRKTDIAGLEIQEARITHLAYAPEIAAAMLQRQQATAIVAARQLIVDGAVGMVELALNKLREKSVIELDEERKAAMVSNLLVVLCGNKDAQPIVNSGSLY